MDVLAHSCFRLQWLLVESVRLKPMSPVFTDAALRLIDVRLLAPNCAAMGSPGLVLSRYHLTMDSQPTLSSTTLTRSTYNFSSNPLNSILRFVYCPLRTINWLERKWISQQPKQHSRATQVAANTVLKRKEAHNKTRRTNTTRHSSGLAQLVQLLQAGSPHKHWPTTISHSLLPCTCHTVGTLNR